MLIKVLKTVFNILFCIVIGWFIGNYILPQHNRVPDKLLFKIDYELSNYGNALHDLEHYYVENKNGEKNNNYSKLRSRYFDADKRVNNILSEALQKYGNELKNPIDNFLQWENLVDITDKNKFKEDNRNGYYGNYLDRREGIDSALSKITGIHHVTDQKYTGVMSILPQAKDNLKENPNDPVLCNVMQKYWEREDVNIIAAQIAFLEMGDKFCSEYFHKKSSWGKLAENEKNAAPKKNNEYYSLTYEDYHEKYVIPQIPKAIKLLENGALKYKCTIEHFDNSERNPSKDAFHIAQLRQFQKYCQNENYKNDYFSTPLGCIFLSESLYGKGFKNDLIEHCRMTEKPIFND